MESLSQLNDLLLWIDLSERTCAENLAVDEALLEVAKRPILRCYQWQDHAVTLGYFQRWQELVITGKASNPLPSSANQLRVSANVDIARRWTGGGMVDHRGDRPYTLVIPADHPLAAMRAGDSYHWIHLRLAAALTLATALDAVASDLSAPGTEPAMTCFASPVAWDVIDGSSRKKIAGAAQRRSRGRLLHQGSVILGDDPRAEQASDLSATPAPPGWPEAFAEALAPAGITHWEPGAAVLERAADLAASRYATRAWRERF